MANNSNDALKQKIADTIVENAPQDALVRNARTAWFSYRNYEIDKDRMTASINFDADRDLTDAEYERMAQAVFDVTESLNHVSYTAITSDFDVYVETDMEINVELDEGQKDVLDNGGFLDKAVNAVYNMPGDAELRNVCAKYTESHNKVGDKVTNLLMTLRTDRELDHDEMQLVVDEVKEKMDLVLEEDFSAAVNSISTSVSFEK